MDILDEAESAVRKFRARLSQPPPDKRREPSSIEASESGFDLSPNFSLEFGGISGSYAPAAAPDEFTSHPIEPGQEKLAPGQERDDA